MPDSQTTILIILLFAAIVYLVYITPFTLKNSNEAYTQNSASDNSINNIIYATLSAQESIAKKLVDFIASKNDNVNEGFYGSYRNPYYQPYYYWPYNYWLYNYYSGCNEDVFGNIKCLPFAANPFW
jgi:hypothetical protein